MHAITANKKREWIWKRAGRGIWDVSEWGKRKEKWNSDLHKTNVLGKNILKNDAS